MRRCGRRCRGLERAMKRSPAEVHQAVLIAFQNSTRQWVPGQDDDPDAIHKSRTRFIASLIAPEVGNVEVEPHVAATLSLGPGAIPVWFVTGPAAQRVFLDERTDNFGSAWGPERSTGRYVDLGFRTSDPIDAFLA